MSGNGKFQFNTIEEAVEALRNGEIIIVVDDEDRENEGDFITAASHITPEKINFMAKHGRGLICVPMAEDRLHELHLNQMATDNNHRLGTNFTISVDARLNTTTGISAFDRARTVKALIDPNSKPDDLMRPGHIFPLKASKGGVLERPGHTEATVDLARIAGLAPAGVLCEVMHDDGTMARVPELMKIAKKFQLKIITIADLISYRNKTEELVDKIVSADFPTRFGHFTLHFFEGKTDGISHLALVKGAIEPQDSILVRLHSQCLTGDLLHSLRCDCGEQLEESLKRINARGQGILLYMCQEGRGIGLANKIKAYYLQDMGKDTVEANEALGFDADLREYGISAQILKELGVKKVALLTNNPKKVLGLRDYGFEQVERVPLEIPPNHINQKYLATKRDKLGHLIMEGH
jgi:3,4-dihydroxy 2-butanone 4-phosphate synthase/GTP cyclohydrolase II